MPVMPSASSKIAPAQCGVCKRQGCDVTLLGCGCTIHVTCLPLSLILDNNKPGDTLPLGPRHDNCLPCPVCSSGVVQGIRVLPLCFDPLHKAIGLRVVENKASRPGFKRNSTGSLDSFSGNKRERSDSEVFLEVEAAQAVFSQGTRASRSGESDSRRTGRWTDEEVEYVDVLMKTFDRGQLPVPHGTKLASFLCDALLCKASRLTKKMKHAKLSARSFEFQPSTLWISEESTMLHSLQEKFIKSMPLEYSRLELDFNFSMHWRTCLSDLCVQVGYRNLDGASFLESLEEFERLATNAEESMRNVRRRRMAETYLSSSSISSKASSDAQKTLIYSDFLRPSFGDSAAKMEKELGDEIDLTFDVAGTPNRNRFDEEDLETNNAEALHDSLTEFMESEELRDYNGPPNIRGQGPIRVRNTSQNPFMEVIAEYLEELDLPFQHADTWVPSINNSDGSEAVRLIHAGAVTRRDQDAERWAAFENFGEYSKGFTFTPGKGLVGRVYSTKTTLWEYGVNKLDPNFFLRAGGAEEYGVRTAVGIPFPTPGVGLMVVILYSCNHIPEDILLANQFARELSRYAPAPKWKLVVEMADTPSTKHHDETSLQRQVSINDAAFPNEDSFWGTEDLAPTMQLGKDAVGASFEHPRNTKDSYDLVSFLGEQLASTTTSSFDDPSLFEHLMLMRLMFLRPASRRSAEENDVIEILKNSYKNYAAGGRRNGKEIVVLLVQEWKCLSQSFSVMNKGSMPPVASPMNAYRSHEFPSSLEPLHGQAPGIPSLDIGKGMSAPVKLSTNALSGANTKCPVDFFDHSTQDPVVLFDHSRPSFLASLPSNTLPSAFLLAPSSTMTRTVSCGTSLTSDSNFQALNNQGTHRSRSFLSNSTQL